MSRQLTQPVRTAPVPSDWQNPPVFILDDIAPAKKADISPPRTSLMMRAFHAKRAMSKSPSAIVAAMRAGAAP